MVRMSSFSRLSWHTNAFSIHKTIFYAAKLDDQRRHPCSSRKTSNTPLSRHVAQSRIKLRVSNNNDNVDKGFNLLELASGIVPQGMIVQTTKEGWKFAWQRMMTELAPQDKDTGEYRRPSYNFNGAIGTSPFPPLNENDRGRYHLYVGNPCPWCHRAVLAAGLLDLLAPTAKSSNGQPPLVGVTRLLDDPVKASRGGWVFAVDRPDPIYQCGDLRELYDKLVPGGFRGRCTAPLLVDRKLRQIVSNESSDIVRMLSKQALLLDGGGNDGKRRIDLYPAHLAEQIDETNDWVYQLLNNGVYRCGFSTTQSAYDKASGDVQTGLARCDKILAESTYLCGDSFTEADLRLLPTILRFDGAYAPLFKAGGSHLRIQTDYPNIYRWMQTCWAMHPAVRESIDIPDACSSYYKQLFPLNPGGIIPSPVTAESLGLES